MKGLASQIQASNVSNNVLKEALRSFGVKPYGTTRAELSQEYARTACGRARLSLAGGSAGGDHSARAITSPSSQFQPTPEPGEDQARQGVEEAEVLRMLFGMEL